MTFRRILQPLAILPLLTLLLALPATAFEVFRAAAPSLGSISDEKPVAVGSTWAAYVETTSQITVVDTATRAVLHAIPRPADRTPIPDQAGWVRTITTFGQKLTTDGTWLVALSPSSLEQLAQNGSVLQKKNNYTVHVWKMPGAQFIGAADIDESPGETSSFIGVGNGRVIYYRSGVRNIRRWDVETLAPQSGISIPAGTPGLDDTLSSGPVAMGGNDLVYLAADALRIYRLYHVDLTSGSVAELPKPAGRETSSFRHLAVGAGHLLAPGVAFPLGADTPMAHYDLSTRQIVALTVMPGDKTTFPYIAPDGSWRAVSVGYNGAPAEMRSGSAPGVAGSAVFELPRGFTSSGVIPAPFAYAQGHLWFRAGGVPDGTVAYRIPAAVQPIARLTGRCLPADEADGFLKVVFTLDHAVARDVVLQVRTQAAAGSATAGSDFQPFDGEVTLAAGASEAVVQIPLIQNSVIEENETLVVEIAGHPADIQVSEKEIPGIIGGSSFHRLPPVAGWESEAQPSVTPYHIAVAGDHLVQTNSASSGPTAEMPRVLTRPLEGGEWTPSTALASIPFDWNEITTNAAGLALISSPNSVRIYHPATDTLLSQTPGTPGNLPHVSMGDTHFMVGTSTVIEYSLTPPYASRRPVASLSGTISGRGAYADDVMIGHFANLPGGDLHKISRANQADLGEFITGSGWVPQDMAADGNLFAGQGVNGVWFRSVAGSGRLMPVRTANGPFGYITDVRVAANRVWVTEKSAGDVPAVRIFEVPSGLECGMLLGTRGGAGADFTPYVPEGMPPLGREPGSGDHYDLECFSFGGKNIVAAIRWPELGSAHLVAARFIQEAGLPGIVDPAPVREDAGAMMLTLTEAAPFPLTVTTRMIEALHNQAEDWTGSGSTIVIPAGTTTFSTGVLPFNDKLPEASAVASPLELTITGNGITRITRIAVQVEDDDQMPLSSVPHTLADFGPGFAPVAGGWAYRADSAEENLVAWTGSAAFIQGSPFGTPASRAFGNAMAGTGTWLAVAHDAWGGTAKGAKPSQIQIYQPASRGRTPVRTLKGMKYFNRFGQTLFARDTTLWVGAPGSSIISPKPKNTKGMVLQYDLPTGKKRRTFKAPKTHAIGFGSSIAANATSVWIGSPVSGGAVFHYDRAKGKLLRTLVNRVSGVEQTFGTAIEANATTLVANSTYPNTQPQPLRGYSAATGQLQWQLDPPVGRHFGSFTLIGEDLLVTGGESLIFYYLPPAGPPELLVEVLMPEDANHEVVEIKAVAGELALRRTQNSASTDDAVILTLAGIPKLAPYLTGSLAASASTAADTAASIIAPPPALTLSQSPGGAWQLNLPAAEAVANGTRVEFSIDLTKWDPLATVGSDASWQLVPAAAGSAALEGVNLVDGVSLQVPPNRSRVFFRLHTP